MDSIITFLNVNLNEQRFKEHLLRYVEGLAKFSSAWKDPMMDGSKHLNNNLSKWLGFKELTVIDWEFSIFLFHDTC